MKTNPLQNPRRAHFQMKNTDTEEVARIVYFIARQSRDQATTRAALEDCADALDAVIKGPTHKGTIRAIVRRARKAIAQTTQ